MPYGLSLAPAVFQSLINDMLWQMLGKYVIAYIDDISSYSPNEVAHIQHVQRVMLQLFKHQLYVKGENCQFHVHKVAFLGYIIGPEWASFSKKLSPAKRNYDIGKWELLVVKLSLREGHHWLEGGLDLFKIYTDHKIIGVNQIGKKTEFLTETLGLVLCQV